MKKVTISVEYDEDKMKALKYFLKQKGEDDVPEKLVDALESLYKRVVPITVREYIEATADNSKKNS
jgi:hypothetical protein